MTSQQSRAAARKAHKAGENLTAVFHALPMRQRKEGLASPLPPRYDRDRQRSRVYSAEAEYTRLVNQRDTYPQVSIAGVRIDVPDTLRFGDLRAAQAYTDAVTEANGASRISVVAHARLANRAHYSGGVITLPLAGADHRWAWRDDTVLHEIAHHLTAGHHHGPVFAGRMVELFTDWVSPQAGLLLRILYDQDEVQVA